MPWARGRREPVAPRIEPALAVATFDSAWSRIRSTYYDSTFRGLDWQAIGDSLRPRGAAATDPRALRGAIEGLFTVLGESHFVLIPGDVVERSVETHDSTTASSPGDVGLEIRLIGRDAVVSRVEPDSPAWEAGIVPGWRVERIGSLSVAPYVRRRVSRAAPRERALTEARTALSLMARLAGPAGTRLPLVFRDAGGARRHRTVPRRPVPGEVVRFGHLPPIHVRLAHERRADAHGCVGVIRFNSWMTTVMPRLDAALGALRDCRAIVLDLRGNVGGVAAMVMGVGGHFLDSAVTLGTITSRGNTLRYLANPRRVGADGARVHPFAGPLAILVDALSVSTSEIFAAAMQQLGRARVFGERTPGQALPATLVRLPNGDVMQHVVADLTTVDGGRLEGRGVVPDEDVPLRRGDLLAGRDASLAAALRWIDAQGGRTTAAHPPPAR